MRYETNTNFTTPCAHWMLGKEGLRTRSVQDWMEEWEEGLMQFEWSESGLNCLRKIQNEISNHGGLEYYRNIVIDEQQGNHLKIDKFADKKSLEIMIEHGMTIREMAMVLRKTFDSVSNLLTYYELK